MSREKRTRNTPQIVIDEIMEKHRRGTTKRELADEYAKPMKTIENMITRENNKKRREEAGSTPEKVRGRKPAVTLEKWG